MSAHKHPDATADEDSGRQLPYDPDDWAERLAEARERRARVIEARMRQVRNPDPAEPQDDPTPTQKPQPAPDPAQPTAAAPDAGTAPVPPDPASLDRPTRPEPPDTPLTSAPASATAFASRKGPLRGIWIAATLGAFCFGVGLSLPVALVVAPDVLSGLVSDGGSAPDRVQASETGPQTDVPPAPGGLFEVKPPPSDAAPQVPSPTPSAPQRAETPPEPETINLAVTRPVGDMLAGPLGPGGDAFDAIIHLNLPNGAPRERFATIATSLQSAGFTDVRSARTPYTIRDTQVRYYHSADLDAARAVASQTGAILRDFTDYRPSPAPGSIELWLAGQAAQSASRSGSSGGDFSLSREVEAFRSAVSDLFESFPGARDR